MAHFTLRRWCVEVNDRNGILGAAAVGEPLGRAILATPSKALTRERTYRALIEYIEEQT